MQSPSLHQGWNSVGPSPIASGGLDYLSCQSSPMQPGVVFQPLNRTHSAFQALSTDSAVSATMPTSSPYSGAVYSAQPQQQANTFPQFAFKTNESVIAPHDQQSKSRHQSSHMSAMSGSKDEPEFVGASPAFRNFDTEEPEMVHPSQPPTTKRIIPGPALSLNNISIPRPPLVRTESLTKRKDSDRASSSAPSKRSKEQIKQDKEERVRQKSERQKANKEKQEKKRQEKTLKRAEEQLKMKKIRDKLSMAGDEKETPVSPQAVDPAPFPDTQAEFQFARKDLWRDPGAGTDFFFVDIILRKFSNYISFTASHGSVGTPLVRSFVGYNGSQAAIPSPQYSPSINSPFVCTTKPIKGQAAVDTPMSLPDTGSTIPGSTGKLQIIGGKIEEEKEIVLKTPTNISGKLILSPPPSNRPLSKPSPPSLRGAVVKSTAAIAPAIPLIVGKSKYSPTPSQRSPVQQYRLQESLSSQMSASSQFQFEPTETSTPVAAVMQGPSVFGGVLNPSPALSSQYDSQSKSHSDRFSTADDEEKVLPSKPLPELPESRRAHNLQDYDISDFFGDEYIHMPKGEINFDLNLDAGDDTTPSFQDAQHGQSTTAPLSFESMIAIGSNEEKIIGDVFDKVNQWGRSQEWSAAGEAMKLGSASADGPV